MFKSTGKSGLRRAGGGGAPQASGRISSPMNKFRSRFLDSDNLRQVAFQSSPQEHGFDSKSSRLSGLEK